MFGDLAKMMKVAAEVKRKMPELRERIEAGRHTAEAGEGAVSATVDGKGRLVDLRIDAKVAGGLAAEDGAEALAETVRSAVAGAQEMAAQAAREAMKELTGGVELAGLNDMLGM